MPHTGWGFFALIALVQAVGEQLPLPLDGAQAAARVGSAALEEQSTSRPRRRSRGGTGTLVSGGLIEDLDPNSEVHAQNWIGQPGKLGLAAKMLSDPHVRQSAEAMISPLLNGTWRYRPVSKSPLDREVADFLNFAWFECFPWKRTIRKAVRGYLKDGVYLAEATEDNAPIPADRFPTHPGQGIGVLPSAFHERPAWSITRWRPSKRNPEQLRSVQQWLRGGDAEQGGYVDIPASRLIRWTWDQEGGDFRGNALFRAAYQPFKLKRILLTIWAILHERNGIGTPTMTMGENAEEEDIAAAETILAELRANEKAFLLLPNGWEFGWSNIEKSRGTELEKAINICNIDIAHVFALGFMLLGLTGEVGSFALGGTQQGQHHLQISGHGSFNSDVFNFGSDGWSPARRLVELNYGPDVRTPILEIRNLPTRDWQKVIDTLVKAKQAGLVRADDPTEEQIREVLQFDPHDENTARGGAVEPTSESGPPPPQDETEDDAGDDMPEEEAV